MHTQFGCECRASSLDYILYVKQFNKLTNYLLTNFIN